MDNVTALIQQHVKRSPDKHAVSFRNKFYSFSQFDERINQFCNKLVSLGVKPQQRVLFFVRPNLDFAAITFALFRLGAIPVFIDPGMKREYFLNAIEEVQPDVLLGIPKVQFLAKVKKNHFKSIKLFIQTGHIPFLGSFLYSKLKKMDKLFKIYRPQKGDLAAILYTSGGTGAPKGVEYTHDIFINQTKMLKEAFDLSNREIDIPGFPLFSFFSLALGMRSHVPDIDISKPAEIDAKQLYQDIVSSNASFLAGSPAIWDRLADYCLQNNLKLISVKQVVMFGAPVDVKLHEKFAQILTDGTTFTPYGATECLPIASISGEEVLKNFKVSMQSGKGICVGKPLKGVDVKIIKSTDEVIENLKDADKCQTDEVGEIIVHSPNVTEKYFQKSDATQKAKIYDGNKTWHRMGDVGYLDNQGYLWYCGRKRHVVAFDDSFFYPSQIEAIFNKHPKVKRSALVSDPKSGKPTVVIQRNDGREEIENMLLMDLKNLAQSHNPSQKIHHFVAKASFPLDVRHNIKIDRSLLSKELYQ